MPPLAADPGFSFAEPYFIALAIAGVATFVAIGALSHEHERAWSASIIYLVLGLATAPLLSVIDLPWVEPLEDPKVLERLSELAVVAALFSTGMSLDRELTFRAWRNVRRLLLLAMPLTIAAVAVLGHRLLGLSVGAAIILGATLAPTDPVLAGDVRVGPPGEEDASEPHFSLTAEAGLNDGLAFPFVLLGAFVASANATAGDWVAEWLTADVLYGLVGGTLLGGAGGWLLAAATVRLRNRELLGSAFDGWLAVAAVLLLYGSAEVAGVYGFLTVFFGGLGFRRYEAAHEVNRGVHHGAEIVEKFSELALILLLGTMVGRGSIGHAGVEGFVLVALLLVVIRPLAVLLSLVRTTFGARERTFVAWFGVRGIGSLYYVAVALGLGVLSRDEASTLFWTVAACIVVSIVVHGSTAAPLSRRLLEPVPEGRQAPG